MVAHSYLGHCRFSWKAVVVFIFLNWVPVPLALLHSQTPGEQRESTAKDCSHWVNSQFLVSLRDFLPGVCQHSPDPGKSF